MTAMLESAALVISALISTTLAIWALQLTRRIRGLEERLQERSSKLHAFAVELIRTEEEQRLHIARELHDSLGQMMTAVNLELGVLLEAALPPELRQKVEDVGALAAQVTTEVRRISQELRPAILDEMGLAEAVRALVGRVQRHKGPKIDLELVPGLDPLPADAAIATYRLVQEALNNVVRHSEAARAKVRLARAGDRLEVEVSDDGKGINYDPNAQVDTHFGLLGLQERIRALGGTFSFGPGVPRGTRVSAQIPIGFSS